MLAIFWVIALFILLEVQSYIYFNLFVRLPILRKTVFLGIFFHEFSHFLLCKLTGAPVFEFKVGHNEGFVKHGNSKIPLIGNLLISLAPLFLGVSILLIIFINLSSLTLNDFSVMPQSGTWIDFNTLLDNIKIVLYSFDYKNIMFWVFLFFSLNILVALKPSHQDLKNITIAIITYGFFSRFAFMMPVNILIIFMFLGANILQFVAIVILSSVYLIKRLFIR